MLTPPELVYRGEKGSALTSNELDQDFRSLRDFANALAEFMGISLNLDGTIKDGAITSASQIADRIVTAAKLHWHANLFGTAAGTDTYTLTINPSTPAISSYGDAITTTTFLIVKFTNANTGTVPCTLALNGLAAAPIYKNGTQQLAATDIAAGEIHLLAFDGANWQLMTPHPTIGATRSVFRVTLSSDFAVPPAYAIAEFNSLGTYGFDVDSVWHFSAGVDDYKMSIPDDGEYVLMFESMSVNTVDWRIMKNVDQPVEQIYSSLFSLPLYVAHHIGLYRFDEADVIHMESQNPLGANVYGNRTWFSGYKLP